MAETCLSGPPTITSELQALHQSMCTVTFDADGTIVRANNRFLQLLGYGIDDVIGQTEAFLMAGASNAKDIWPALKAGEHQSVLRTYKMSNNALVLVRARFVPICDDDGTVREIVQLSTNETENLNELEDNRGQVEAINATQAIAHFMLDGTFLHANERFLDATGYTLDELKGRKHSLLVRVDDAASQLYSEFWAELQRGHHQNGEYRQLRKDGQDIWLQSTYSPILDGDGNPFKIVLYANDVTTEKNVQADYRWQINAIRKSNCVVEFDMHGTVLDANDLFLDAMGYELDDLVGSHHRLLVDDAYAHSDEYAAFWQGLKNGLHKSGQFRRIGKNGNEVWLQASYNPIFDASGRPIKIVKYASVVTEERLHRADHQGQIAALHRAQSVVTFALDGTILDANQNFLDAVGYKYADVRGRHHSMFVTAKEAKSDEYRAFWRALANGEYQAAEFRRIGNSGKEVWLRATYSPIFGLDGKPFKVVKHALDVTEEKMARSDVASQVAAIWRSQGVVTLGLDGTILNVNDNFLDVIGYDLPEVRGKHHSMLVEKDVIGSDEYEKFWNALRSGDFHSGLYKRIGKGGRELWIQATYNPILDSSGKPTKIIKFATDVSENIALAEAFADVRRQAQYDTTTTLPNRARLSTFLGSVLDLPGARVVVLYLDLDDFKPVNDTFGHHVGDRVLGELSDRFRRTLRRDQMVARVGGDEFVVVAPDLPEDGIERLCKSLLAAASTPFRVNEADIKIGASIGISVSGTDGTTPDELIRCADAALYEAKGSGKNNFRFFSRELDQRLSAERQLVEDMRRGLVSGEFYLEYQPRFETVSRKIKSAEALVRWAHPERGRISPMDFIPAAERSGLIIALGRWVMETACRDAAQWPDFGVSVNVSPVQFQDGELVDMVSQVLTDTGLAAHLLEIEVTEGVLIAGQDHVKATLKALKELGVKLAIDDFGTGYSSLNYLQNYPFDAIKIDRCFISGVEDRKGNGAIVQAVISLARALGLSVTAEGVETQEQLACLANDQCQEVQGFLLAKPMSGPDLLTMAGGGVSTTEEVLTEAISQLIARRNPNNPLRLVP